MKMNVLSLFDGMSCGRIALERCGFPVTNYFASEIDKYAITVARANFPDTMHLGDVKTVTTSEDGELIINDPLGIQTAKIDLLIGGSPCQGFSWAGKRLNFEDPRSALFFEYVRLLRELKPRWFLLENVNMKQEHQDVISEQLGVKPIRINSNLVSAQNRDRLYWTNIPVRSMPENKRIYLKDILEDGWTDRDKSHCIDANYFKGGNLKSYFEKNRRQLVFDFEQEPEGQSGLILAGEADLKGHGYNRRVYHPDGKAPTLAAASGGNLEPKILYPAAIVGRRLKDGVRDDNDTSVPITQCLEVHESGGKARCLSTVEKDTLVSPLPEGRYPDAYSEEMRLMWRKLTPTECERLQTVPDGYTAHVSNTQRYRMLGNGWTVDVICHLLEGMKDG
jgi:DNA-cytosine methyltransferase